MGHKLLLLKSRLYGKKSYPIRIETVDKIRKIREKPSFYDILQKPLKSNSFVRLNLKNRVFPVLMVESMYKPQTMQWLKDGNFLRGTLRNTPFLLAYDDSNQFIGQIPSHILLAHLEQWLDCKGLRKNVDVAVCKYLCMADVNNLKHPEQFMSLWS